MRINGSTSDCPPHNADFLPPDVRLYDETAPAVHQPTIARVDRCAGWLPRLLQQVIGTPRNRAELELFLASAEQLRQQARIDFPQIDNVWLYPWALGIATGVLAPPPPALMQPLTLNPWRILHRFPAATSQVFAFHDQHIAPRLTPTQE